MSTQMSKMMKSDNTRVLEVLMFYENRKSQIYKVFCVVVYFVLYKYVCTDYFCLPKNQMSFSHQVF